MLRFLVLLIGIMVAFAGAALRADEGGEKAPNCKLIVRTRLQNGKRRLEIFENFTQTRKECRIEALERELSSDADIAAVKATFTWRQLEN